MVKIRKCYIEDIKLIKYLQPDGWSDISFFFRFYCMHKFCYPIVALSNNHMVGVANAIENDRTGWLAHIIVAPKYRRKGIGSLLTNHLVDYLFNKNCKTLLLIATEMGKPIYSKLGFEIVSDYVFFDSGKIMQNNRNKNIRKFHTSDIDEVLKLDQYISGENRTNMLTQFLKNAWIYQSQGHIKGFFLPEIKEGMILALDDESGLALLEFKHATNNCKTVLPAENIEGLEFLLSHGFRKVNKAPRMIMGEKIGWKPELIYSRAGGFYG